MTRERHAQLYGWPTLGTRLPAATFLGRGVRGSGGSQAVAALVLGAAVASSSAGGACVLATFWRLLAVLGWIAFGYLGVHHVVRLRRLEAESLRLLDDNPGGVDVGRLQSGRLAPVHECEYRRPSGHRTQPTTVGQFERSWSATPVRRGSPGDGPSSPRSRRKAQCSRARGHRSAHGSGGARSTRSSWTGGPGFLPFLPRFLPNADHRLAG